MTQDAEKRSNPARGIALRFGATVATLAMQAALLYRARRPYFAGGTGRLCRLCAPGALPPAAGHLVAEDGLGSSRGG